MPRKRRAEIVIHIPPLAKRDFDKFLEKLSKSLYGDTVIGEITHDKIKLYIYGSRLSIHRTVRLVRQLVKEYSTPKTSKGRVYSLRALSKEAKTALPPDVLVEVLKYAGFSAIYTEGKIITDANEEEILYYARRIGQVIIELANINASRTVKKILITVKVFAPDMPLSHLANLLVELGIAKYDEDGKLVPARDWREGLKELMRQL